MRTSPLFLIDTNVVSELGKPCANPNIVLWIEGAPMGSLAISWSTVFELQYGVESARNAGSNKADAYEHALSDLIEDPRFQMLYPTTEAARTRARMHATPALKNFVLAHPGSKKQATGEDLTIAATAIAAGAVIVTSNVRDFMEIDRYFRLPGLIEPNSGEWVISPAGMASIAGTRSDDPTEGSSPIVCRSPFTSSQTYGLQPKA
ncbi:PIN domain-containing protein [Fulvimarina sp. MAC8]|uniref:PIN domain-containing protein n=1 Tax=Fulvimarina sp. MAC8 TaxID=3162874 RepID=UPI0032EBE002